MAAPNSGTEVPPANLEVILDVPVKVTVELGSCQMPMREVLQLASGSVVQLDKIAEAPVDLYVNQKRIAHGEVVVVEDRLGIRITKVLGGQSA
jgi:flagellar motor switch protein FliN/FliY